MEQPDSPVRTRTPLLIVEAVWCAHQGFRDVVVAVGVVVALVATEVVV